MDISGKTSIGDPSSPPRSTGLDGSTVQPPTSFGETFSESQSKGSSSFVPVGENTFRQDDDPGKKQLAVLPSLIGFRLLNFSGSLFQIEPKAAVADVVLTAIHHLPATGDAKSVLFQVEGSIPMDILIEKNNHKLTITISMSSENKQRLITHLPELSQLIAKKIDYASVDISLQTPAQFGQGGNQNSGQQSNHSKQDESEVAFDMSIDHD